MSDNDLYLEINSGFSLWTRSVSSAAVSGNCWWNLTRKKREHGLGVFQGSSTGQITDSSRVSQKGASEGSTLTFNHTRLKLFSNISCIHFAVTWIRGGGRWCSVSSSEDICLTTCILYQLKLCCWVLMTENTPQIENTAHIHWLSPWGDVLQVIQPCSYFLKTCSPWRIFWETMSRNHTEPQRPLHITFSLVNHPGRETELFKIQVF